jgi:hypothetical protein
MWVRHSPTSPGAERPEPTSGRSPVPPERDSESSPFSVGDQDRVADQKERGTGFRLALVSIHLKGAKRDTIRDIVVSFRDVGFSEGIWP